MKPAVLAWVCITGAHHNTSLEQRGALTCPALYMRRSCGPASYLPGALCALQLIRRWAHIPARRVWWWRWDQPVAYTAGFFGGLVECTQQGNGPVSADLHVPSGPAAPLVFRLSWFVFLLRIPCVLSIAAVGVS